MGGSLVDYRRGRTTRGAADMSDREKTYGYQSITPLRGMSSNGPKQHIVVTEDAKTLPTNELLTGRGFICGKSGSGKSNTLSVIAEELLDANFSMLIVDTDGEYFGLKEQYELLHAGVSEECDLQVEPDHGEQLARTALEENLPVILDVSEIMEEETERQLVKGVVEHLFTKEKQLRKPFLLCIEEAQEFIPQKGGKDELADLLIRVSKRGRKRGLGICAISQRPSSVDKDFVTQCDWMVWHRMTWQNDVDLVADILGDSYGDEVDGLNDGEAFLMTDWDESLERVKFRKKKTFDAGGTPGLEQYSQPSLKSIDGGVLDELFEETDIGLSTDVAPAAGGREPSDSPASASSAADGPGAADALEPLFEASEADSSELDTSDPEALKAELERQEKRNQVLEDEVAELKSIIKNIEAREDAASPELAERDPPASSPPDVVYEEPEDGGVANYLVEFGLLVTYLFYRGSDLVKRSVLRVSDPSPAKSPVVDRGNPAYPIEHDSPGPVVYLVIGGVIFVAALLLMTLIWLVVVRGGIPG